MSWHIIAQIGKDDHFEPTLAEDIPRIHAVFERTDDRWYVNNNAVKTITEVFGHNLRASTEDLIYLALAVYTADLRVPRGLAEDRWSRNFVLYVPVFETKKWAAARKHIERTLAFLTGDVWSVEFRERGEQTQWKSEKEVTVPNIEKVCLFSGGLDSLIGAIDLLDQKTHVALVGHYGAGVTNSFQENALKAVTDQRQDQATPFMFHAQPPKRKIKDGEPSMRSRSFLFFAMGVAVADTVGKNTPLVIAENGFISLNVPLTSSRAGSASTRTTHPHYIELYRGMLKRMGLAVPLELPYRFMTKGEMLAACKEHSDTVLSTATPLTMSCSHAEAGRFRGSSPKDHCGYCVPCIIRRAATEAAHVADANYSVHVKTARPDYKTDSGRDARAFEMAVKRGEGHTLDRAVFTILGQGPLPSDDIKQYAEMYLRGLAEVRALIG